MSKEHVAKLSEVSQTDDSVVRTLAEEDVDTVIRVAANLNPEFTKSELETVLKEMIYTAKSLPHGWDWPLARRIGLVRS
jgi:hypothetical protein